MNGENLSLTLCSSVNRDPLAVRRDFRGAAANWDSPQIVSARSVGGEVQHFAVGRPRKRNDVAMVVRDTLGWPSVQRLNENVVDSTADASDESDVFAVGGVYGVAVADA